MDISLPRALGAYFAAVSAATLVFTLPRFTPFTLLLAWLMAFGAALLPYAAGIAYANWRGIRSWRYFLGGGVGTALLYALPLAMIHRPAHLLKLLPWLVLAGCAAAAACWRVLKSAHDENTVPAICCGAGGGAGAGPLAPMAGWKAKWPRRLRAVRGRDRME